MSRLVFKPKYIANDNQPEGQQVALKMRLKGYSCRYEQNTGNIVIEINSGMVKTAIKEFQKHTELFEIEE